MSNLLKNWKTTSSGLLMVISAVVAVVFPQMASKIIAACTGVLGGLGLIFAGDASQSVQSGDTTQITPVAPTAASTEATITKP